LWTACSGLVNRQRRRECERQTLQRDQLGNPANTGTYGVVSRPNVVGDPYAGNRTVDLDFNPAAS
jgi:hypothetical protein